MAISHNLSVPKDKLVFAHDYDSPRSWRGAPTTNLAKNSNGTIDWTTSNLVASITRTTVITDERFKIASTTGGAFRFNFNSSKLTNGQTYVMSFKYKILTGSSPDFRATDWCDTTITRTTVSTGDVDNSFYETASGTRSTYDNTYDFMDFTISANTEVEIWDIQLEEAEIASPYTTYERTTTESVIDLVQGTTVTVNDIVRTNDYKYRYQDLDRLTVDKTFSEMFPSLDTWSLVVVAKRNGSASTNQSHGIVFGIQGFNAGIMWGTNNTAYPTTWYYNGTSWLNVGPGGLGSTLDDTWYHLVMTFDAYSDFKFYVNGSQHSTTTVSDETDNNNNQWRGFSVGGTTQPITIGGGSSTYGFNGSVAHASAYDKALTADEVSQHFSAMRGRFGL